MDKIILTEGFGKEQIDNIDKIVLEFLNSEKHGTFNFGKRLKEVGLDMGEIDLTIFQNKLASLYNKVWDVFKELNIDLHLFAGGLLGYKRNGWIIPHDDDIDLGASYNLIIKNLEAIKGKLSSQNIQFDTENILSNENHWEKLSIKIISNEIVEFHIGNYIFDNEVMIEIAPTIFIEVEEDYLKLYEKYYSILASKGFDKRYLLEKLNEYRSNYNFNCKEKLEDFNDINVLEETLKFDNGNKNNLILSWDKVLQVRYKNSSEDKMTNNNITMKVLIPENIDDIIKTRYGEDWNKNPANITLESLERGTARRK